MKLMWRGDFIEASARWLAIGISSICEVGAPGEGLAVIVDTGRNLIFSMGKYL